MTGLVQNAKNFESILIRMIRSSVLSVISGLRRLALIRHASIVVTDLESQFRETIVWIVNWHRVEEKQMTPLPTSKHLKHETGAASHHKELWTLLVFQLWCDNFLI